MKAFQQDDLLDSTDFQLTGNSMDDSGKALRREIDRRESDCAKRQSSFLTHDTRMIDGAIEGRCIVEERAAKFGHRALSDRELLSPILGDETSDRLLRAAGSLQALRKWDMADLRQFEGMTPIKALTLYTLLEAGCRSTIETDADMPIDESEKVFSLMRAECNALRVEKFWVLCLDRKNRLLEKVELTVGTATNCLAHPREVFRPAIIRSATAIIAVHNHPSGDPAPSHADIQVTRQLRESAKVIGIELMDHIIIGEKNKDPQCLGYYSFNDAGLV